MNKEWKKRRIREDTVSVKVGGSIDLKINIFLDNVAYFLWKFGFPPVIWALSIVPTCVSNHSILGTAFIFPIGCWCFGHKLGPRYFEGELAETNFFKICLLVETLSPALYFNVRLAIIYQSRIPCLHTSDQKRKDYSQKTIILPIKSVFEIWFLVMRNGYWGWCFEIGCVWRDYCVYNNDFIVDIYHEVLR
jgi:hypothetical protein